MPAPSLEPPPELSLRAGETARFRLRGGGAAGYDWRWTIEGDAVTIVLEPATSAPSAGSLQTGSVALDLALYGAHPGVARLRMELARPAKSALPPLASFSTIVTVSAQPDP